MKVFISWSGATSGWVARDLGRWLKLVLQRLKIWVSQDDIEKGTRWFPEIMGALEDSETRFGIICLSPENLQSPWLHFEAGALAKAIKNKPLVCPYLIGLSPIQVTGPLKEFQMVMAHRDGTKELLLSIDRASEEPLGEQAVGTLFDKWWPDLENTLRTANSHNDAPPPPRTVESMVEEILQLLRWSHFRVGEPPVLPTPVPKPEDLLQSELCDLITSFVAGIKDDVETSTIRVAPLPADEWQVTARLSDGTPRCQLLPKAPESVVCAAVDGARMRLGSSLMNHYDGPIQFVPRKGVI